MLLLLLLRRAFYGCELGYFHRCYATKLKRCFLYLIDTGRTVKQPIQNFRRIHRRNNAGRLTLEIAIPAQAALFCLVAIEHDRRKEGSIDKAHK